MNKQRIIGHFNESAELKIQAAAELAHPIAEAVDLMFSALSNGNRILACGNGGSAAYAQHFAAGLVGRFERERLPLPGLALSTDPSILTAIGNNTVLPRFSPSRCRLMGRLVMCFWRYRPRELRRISLLPLRLRRSETCVSWPSPVKVAAKLPHC